MRREAGRRDSQRRERRRGGDRGRRTAPGGVSTYARIVHLVEQAEADRPRTARLADRAAVSSCRSRWPLPARLDRLGSPVAALAVLVVATPCPLILATPIAFVSGLARAARRGIVVKGGTPLERLGGATVVVFDKTGTLTTGHPRVAEADDELLAPAAAAEHESAHPLAAAIRAEAGARGLALPPADGFRETYGDGVEARVGGRPGARRPSRVRRRGSRAARQPGRGRGVGRDRRAPAGRHPLLRSAARRCGAVVARVHATGARPVLLTGDAAAVAAEIGGRPASPTSHADATPEDKAAVVGMLRREGDVVVMVGDGLNDAPALAAADVGVALGATGSTISSDAADAVILVDDLGPRGRGDRDRPLDARGSRAPASSSAWA